MPLKINFSEANEYQWLANYTVRVSNPTCLADVLPNPKKENGRVRRAPLSEAFYFEGGWWLRGLFSPAEYQLFLSLVIFSSLSLMAKRAQRKYQRPDPVVFSKANRLREKLNDRPRKCLGWRTPREVFSDQAAIVALPN
jgi:hypothetical protein